MLKEKPMIVELKVTVNEEEALLKHLVVRDCIVDINAMILELNDVWERYTEAPNKEAISA